MWNKKVREGFYFSTGMGIYNGKEMILNYHIHFCMLEKYYREVKEALEA